MGSQDGYQSILMTNDRDCQQPISTSNNSSWHESVQRTNDHVWQQPISRSNIASSDQFVQSNAQCLQQVPRINKYNGQQLVSTSNKPNGQMPVLKSSNPHERSLQVSQVHNKTPSLPDQMPHAPNQERVLINTQNPRNSKSRKY